MSGKFSRRHFFYGSLLAGAVPAGGFGSTPSLTAAGYKSFNEKLNIASIGAGIRAGQIVPCAAVTENIVAMCDVDSVRSASVFSRYPNATKYSDFRKLLDKEDKNIDAVMIATPDHNHTPISLLAMQHGKHVYCEKPLTRTFWESELLAQAAVKYKVATQMGNQGFNHEALKTACEILWSGDIGDVREVYAWTGGIYGGQPRLPETGPAKEDIPSTLDWELWLGPAAQRDFNHLLTGQWRAFQDFSTGGSLGDWLVHNIGPAHMALQLDKAPPISVEAVTVEGKNQWLWPDSDHIVFEFPARANMPPVTIHAYQNMRGDEFKNPEGMKEGDRLFPAMNNLANEKNRPFMETGDGLMLITGLGPDGKPVAQAGGRGGGGGGGRGAGAPGTMTLANRGGVPGLTTFPVPPGTPGAAPGTPGAAAGRGGGGGGRGAGPGAANRAPGNGSVFVGSKGTMATTSRGEGVWLLPEARWAEYKLPPQILQRGINHQMDWIRACKGGAPGVSDFAVATKYIQWLCLGAIATRVPGKLMWDAKNQRFSNSEEANKLLKPYMRKGWEFKV